MTEPNLGSQTRIFLLFGINSQNIRNLPLILYRLTRSLFPGQVALVLTTPDYELNVLSFSEYH